MDTASHAVFVSSPEMGHLTPILELAKLLVTVHSFKSTVLLVSKGGTARGPLTPDQYSVVDLLEIPAADISNMVDPGAQMLTKLRVLMRETAPYIRSAISGLVAPSPTVLVLDLFATGKEYFAISRELALPSFVYTSCCVWSLALTVYCPVLDKEVEGEYTDQTQPIDIPGFKPVRPDDVISSMLRRTDPQYTEFLQMGVEISLFDGVLMNTWQGLEGSSLAALRGGDILPVPVYDIGPLVAEPYSNGEIDGILMEWLDSQPTQSVIYISFGSGGTLSTAQMAELACGLELSQQRFVWAIRPPLDSSSFLANMDRYLPSGFIERTREVGKLVPQWAPQSKVLSHPSVGGFLTHCGWNSIVESLTKGVPMMVWPMFAEQRMNATMLVEELKVAIRTCEFPGKKLVGKEEIGKMVRVLLEGDEGSHMRLRAQELQRSAEQALARNGSSYKCLSELLQTLSRQN